MECKAKNKETKENSTSALYSTLTLKGRQLERQTRQKKKLKLTKTNNKEIRSVKMWGEARNEVEGGGEEENLQD